MSRHPQMTGQSRRKHDCPSVWSCTQGNVALCTDMQACMHAATDLLRAPQKPARRPTHQLRNFRNPNVRRVLNMTPREAPEPMDEPPIAADCPPLASTKRPSGTASSRDAGCSQGRVPESVLSGGAKVEGHAPSSGVSVSHKAASQLCSGRSLPLLECEE